MTRNKFKPTTPEPEDTKPSAFDSLADALQGQFDAPLQDLPDGLRERVERAFPPVSWAMLSAEQRRHRAREWDCEHDPAGEEERQRGFDSAEREADIERRMRQLELMNPQTTLEIESKNRQMDELRCELAGVGSQRAGPSTPEKEADACAVFRALKPPLAAEEVRVTFVAGSDDCLLLEITARGNTRRLPPALLSLVNRTSGSLNAQGNALLDLAKGKRLIHSPNNAQIVTRLRKALKHLGIARGAFEAYRPVYGWVPRFKVSDERDAAEKRAAREAERKTVSYDGLRERGWQARAGEDWLKKHDTDEQE